MIARAALVLAIAAVPAIAHAQTAPDLTYCDRLPVDPDALSSRTDPPELPDDWRPFARASRDWMAIRTELGTIHCSNLSWYESLDSYDRFADRFLGFEWSGYEAWGYVLIDPTGTGSEIDTGAKPSFSPGGRRFATVQWSDAGWGGFEGFAVYDIRWRDVTPVHVDTALPYLADWRIDRWEDEDCLHLSAVPYERFEGDWERLQTTERDRYVAGAPTGWRLAPGETCPAYDAG